MILAITGLGFGAEPVTDSERDVRITPNEAERRVDVFVDGQPFTSYIYPTTIKKPVLFPLWTAKGTLVTRGFPLEPRPGERKDHPHHVGVWFNYGNVNELDFWNNSDAIPAARASKMGTILHRKIIHTKSGKDRGELEVAMDWVTADGKPLLHEDTTFIFHAAANTRAIDRITKLTALDQRVVFKDDKEGLFGLRVARALEQPEAKKATAAEGDGKRNADATPDGQSPNGLYRSSEGRTGDDVWGTSGRWVMLSAKVEQEPVTLAILDHPKNPGYPAYWHARGYGLFAVNPLGKKIFSHDKETLDLTLEPHQSVTFRYRLLVLSGETTPDQIEAQYRSFVNDVK
jgi:hypothetical protein